MLPYRTLCGCRGDDLHSPQQPTADPATQNETISPMGTTRIRWLVCGFAACVLVAPAAAAQAAATQADSASIVAILADLDPAWHSADADWWVAHYAPDAQFINIAGTLMPTTEALRARLHDIFRGVFRGTQHVGTLRHLRFIGPDVAVADEDIKITRFSALPSGIRATEPGVLRTRMRHVFQRVGSRWIIVASQNTAVAPRR